jgi:hypothetical protein
LARSLRHFSSSFIWIEFHILPADSKTMYVAQIAPPTVVRTNHIDS